MAETLMIQGKAETIFDDRDFAELLRTRLGSDAEDYFNRAIRAAKQADPWDDDVEET